MSEISFCEEDRPVPTIIDENILSCKLEEIAQSYGSTIETLTYIFCSDDYLLDINKEHLKHDYYTDIITFPYQQGKVIEGDIFISTDRVKDNAEKLNVGEHNELLRVISHGLLHLVGFKDKTKEEGALMREAEDKAIAHILSSIAL